MSELELLSASIEDYCRKLHSNPEVKNEPLVLDEAIGSIPRRQLVDSLLELWDESQTIFGEYALAKYALTLCIERNCLAEVVAVIPAWLRSCVEAGAYQDCVNFAARCETSPEWHDDAVPLDKFSVLRNSAKSLRNIGDLDGALNRYRQIISMAVEVNDQAEISMGLLLIGKLHGNYWGQLSLFSSFVEEAKVRLEHELLRVRRPASKRKRLIRNLAICHDALGQAYRDSDPALVEEHLDNAIKLNKELKRRSGISRTQCHLFHHKFKHAPPREKLTHLRNFEASVKMLLKEDPDERGLGIRYVQLSSLSLEVGDRAAAARFLVLGKSYAHQYSEYKTLTRAALVESSLYKLTDPARAFEALTQGLSIAQKHRLQIMESEINLELVEILSREPTHGKRNAEDDIEELFKRNREIHLGLLNEVKSSLNRFDATGSLPPEFELLSPQTREKFREKLLLDFDRTVDRLDRNIDILVTVLSLNKRKRQELVILEVVNSVARLLLHEYNHTILASATLSTLRDIAAELKTLEEMLDKVRTNLPASSDLIKEVDDLTSALDTKAEQLRSLDDELGNLKSLLSERLRRPRHLNDRVSLRMVTEKAISELVQQKHSLKEVIRFQHPFDIRVLLNHDIMLTVVQNLIRNAVEELGDKVEPSNKIIVSLGSEKIGEANNLSEAGSLAVVTTLGDKSRAAKIASSIRMGLEGHSTTKPSGSGVGMDITKLVFKELMGASIHVIDEDRSAGIKIIFKTDHLNTELVPAEG